MNRIFLKLSFTLLLVLTVSLEAGAEPRRKKNRNRHNNQRNNKYSDDEDESLLGQFSGDSYSDFMERYYTGDNSRGSVLSSTYIDQEDSDDNVEGSGFSDDEDYDNIEGSGEPIGNDNDGQLLPNWPDTTTKRIYTTQSTKASTTSTTTTAATTTSTTPTTTSTIKSTIPLLITPQSPVPSLTPSDNYKDYIDFTDDVVEGGESTNINNGDSLTNPNEMYEGSGDMTTIGSGDGEDCQDDDEDCERKTPGWPINSTPTDLSPSQNSSPSTPKLTPATINPALRPNHKVSTEDPYDDSTIVIGTGNLPEIKPDFEEPIDNYYDPDYEIKDTSTTKEPEVIGPKFGPPKEDVPTFLYENRLLVVAIYSSLVFLLVSSILVVSIVVGVKHCRKKYGFVRVSGEDGSSTDSTASSDLPIIKKRHMMIQHKPSNGLMTAGLGESGVVRYDDASNRSHYAGGRRGSFSPMTHNLPDLSLPADDYKVEKSSKFLDFFKQKSGKNEVHLNRSNNLNSSSRSSKKFDKQNHRDWL